MSSVSSGGNLSQRRKFNILHVLSVSASVSRIRWRPVANVAARDGEDRHDAMLAVATAPIKGASAGGAGTLSLWSFHRPYMPLSVVEGHRDGTVVDFDWLDTPQPSYGIHFGDLNRYGSSGPAQLWQHVISVGRDGHCLIQSLVRGECLMVVLFL
jgi:WD repeat-containing protein 24